MPLRGKSMTRALQLYNQHACMSYTENNYQLHYLVTAVPLENRTIPKKS